MLLTNSQPRSGSNWTDDGSVRQRRELKHRAEGETRPIPIHPELVTMLRNHLKEYGTGPGGRVFSLPRGGIVTDRAYLAVFHRVRAAAFTESEAASLVARRPYDLRHAAVSTWLNASGNPAQVAEWAGHSVDVLLRTYVKCIRQVHRRAAGRGEAANPRSDPAKRGRSAAVRRLWLKGRRRHRNDRVGRPRVLRAYLPRPAAYSRYEPHTPAYDSDSP